FTLCSTRYYCSSGAVTFTRARMIGVRGQHHRSLALSCLGCTAAVILLYATAYEAYRLIGFPYRRMELSLCDWVAKRSRPAPRDARLVLLADDAPSHTLDTLWEDEIAASPVLQMMKRRNWSREIWARTIERLTGAGAAVVAIDVLFQGEEDCDTSLRASV